jgi:hypothetical protein
MIKLLKLILFRYFPLLAKKAFDVKRSRQDKSYWVSFKQLPKSISTLGRSSSKPRLLIVFPANYNLKTFKPAMGNYHFEIFRSAQEIYGSESIQAHYPLENTDWLVECRLIVDTLHSSKVSHLLFYIESKEAKTNLWRWDILAAELKRSNSNVIAIGFLTDGTYDLHQVQCSRFQDIYHSSMFIQIDVPPNSRYIEKGHLVGPTFLPISKASIDLLEEYFLKSKSNSRYEVSFIGKIYGYRQKIIAKLLKKGLNLIINPHVEKNQTDRPSYLSYMDALRRSDYTLNLSRASGTRQKQLKSRILESIIVGSIPITDDEGLTEQTLPEGASFVRFKRPQEILEFLVKQKVVQELDWSASDKFVLVSDEIKHFASSKFWKTLEKGLSDAHLPALAPPSKI